MRRPPQGNNMKNLFFALALMLTTMSAFADSAVGFISVTEFQEEPTHLGFGLVALDGDSDTDFVFSLEGYSGVKDNLVEGTAFYQVSDYLSTDEGYGPGFVFARAGISDGVNYQSVGARIYLAEIQSGSTEISFHLDLGAQHVEQNGWGELVDVEVSIEKAQHTLRFKSKDSDILKQGDIRYIYGFDLDGMKAEVYAGYKGLAFSNIEQAQYGAEREFFVGLTFHTF